MEPNPYEAPRGLPDEPTASVASEEWDSWRRFYLAIVIAIVTAVTLGVWTSNA